MISHPWCKKRTKGGAPAVLRVNRLEKNLRAGWFGVGAIELGQLDFLGKADF